MKGLWSAAVLAAAMAATAQAQPQVQPQLRVNPQVLSAKPALNPRQLELLRGAGITVPPTSVQSATTLSVRTPMVDLASLSFFNVASYTPANETAGVAVLQANPPSSDQSWVQIGLRADARSRYIIDCEVGGAATQYRFVRYTGEGGSRQREETRVPASNGRVGIVLQPRGTAGPQSVHLMGLDQGWQFKSCDITPIG